MPAGGVVEREGGNVELSLDHGAPLFLRLEQGLSGIDLDLQADIGLRDFPGKDLHHLVAHVALAARPLVRGLQGRVGHGRQNEHAGEGRAENSL